MSEESLGQVKYEIPLASPIKTPKENKSPANSFTPIKLNRSGKMGHVLPQMNVAEVSIEPQLEDEEIADRILKIKNDAATTIQEEFRAYIQTEKPVKKVQFAEPPRSKPSTKVTNSDKDKISGCQTVNSNSNASGSTDLNDMTVTQHSEHAEVPRAQDDDPYRPHNIPDSEDVHLIYLEGKRSPSVPVSDDELEEDECIMLTSKFEFTQSVEQILQLEEEEEEEDRPDTPLVPPAPAKEEEDQKEKEIAHTGDKRKRGGYQPRAGHHVSTVLQPKAFVPK